MSSKRETILAAVHSALTGTTGVSTRIYRSRVEAFSRDEHPALVVEPVSDIPDREAVGRLVWQLTFHVIILVRADVPDQAADLIAVDVHSKITDDPTLNGMLVDLMPGAVDFQFLDADKPQGVITLQFRATYQTGENSITS
jgi:hypothetical protein